MKIDKSNNFVRIVLVGIILVVLLLTNTIMYNKIQDEQHKVLLDTTDGMTVSERKKDFKDICNYIDQNVPFIDEYENLYGTSYSELKKYYTSLIKNSTSDFEYYCIVDGFLNNIPSGHMGMQLPIKELIPEFYKYRTNDFYNINSTCDYWEEQIGKENLKYTDFHFDTYLYVNGDYVQSEYYCTQNNMEYQDLTLVSVNNIPIDDFIKICPLEYKLQYDHINNKSYRHTFLLNDTCGYECTAEFRLPDNSLIIKNMYYGSLGTNSLKYIDYFKNKESGKTTVTEETLTQKQDNIDYSSKEIFTDNMYYYNDSQSYFAYIMINDFIGGGKDLCNLLDNAVLPDNIIIDLRNNSGGYEGLSTGIIKKLINHNIDYSAEVLTPDSNFYEEQKLKFVNGRILFSSLRNENVIGESKKKYNIYVLVSGVTISAGDNFAAYIKDNKLGTIIGENNTHGEAYGSPDLKVMKKSGLLFYYTDIKWNNSDGTDNSVYGTAPDIYVPYTKEAMNKVESMTLQNELVITYENRLKWDDVLIKTLELIEEENNDKTKDTDNK